MSTSDDLNIIEVDKISQIEWENILLQFDDANLYQTLEYGINSPGGKNLNHLLVRRKNKIVAAAQVRIIKIKLINRGIAYVFGGPLWRRVNELSDVNSLYSVLNALYNEYVIKRKYLLRIAPNIIENQLKNIYKPLDATNHPFKKSSKGEQTIILDLVPSLEELRKNFRRNWRGHLNRAEKKNLKIVSGTDSKLYDIFQKIYEEMYERKQFSDTLDIYNIGKIQKELPPELKMRIFICYSDEKPLAGTVISSIRDTAIYLLGATTVAGLKSQGSYLIQWNILKWLKEIGCKLYDLGGIDPIANPGVFHFKEGLGGQVSSYVGQYDTWRNWGSWAIVRLGEIFKRYSVYL